MKRHKVLNAIYDYGVAVVILFAVILCLLPVLNVLAISLSSDHAIRSNMVTIFPVEITFNSYLYVFQDPAMIRSMLLTILITVVYTALGMLLTVLAAYPLTKKWLPGRNIFLFIFLFTLYFGGGDIANYLLLKSYGMLNTIWSLILPPALSIFNMIIMKSFFSTIPDSLMESAHIDGASEMRVLIQIIIPLSLPVIASLSLYYAVAKWNSFQDALYFINDSNLYPLQLKLYNIVQSISAPDYVLVEGGGTTTNLAPENLIAASVMFATIPIVCVYPWLQRYFIKGMTIGSIKG
jgi:putative aldouronate transport system permease protein